jgi:hypothetical protein
MEWIWTASYTDVSSLQMCYFKLFKKLSFLVMTPFPKVYRGWSGSGLLRTQTSVAYKCPFLNCIKTLNLLVIPPFPTVEDGVDLDCFVHRRQ